MTTKTFKQQMPTLEPDVLMLVDALNLAFRWKHSKAQHFVEEYLQTVNSLRKSYKASKVIITCDQGSSAYRKSIYPLYKQNRKDKQELQTEQEEEEFKVFFDEFLGVIDRYRDDNEFPLIRFDKVEADDSAAYITNKAVRKGYKVVLVSSDRDWDLLVQPNVMRFSYVTRKEVTLDNWNEHYEYNPDDHISIIYLVYQVSGLRKHMPWLENMVLRTILLLACLLLVGISTLLILMISGQKLYY
jgi:5'-3' exonuclease